jgi:hypothetical protein
MAGGPLLPSSVSYRAAAGLAYPKTYVPATNTNTAGDLEGHGVIASLTSDAPVALQFNMPETIPSGTLKLRCLAMANAVAGVAKLTVSDGATSAAANIGATTLTAETQLSQTWATADILVENKITLTTAPTSNQILTVLAKFNTTGWTLAAESVWQFTIVWE